MGWNDDGSYTNTEGELYTPGGCIACGLDHTLNEFCPPTHDRHMQESAERVEETWGTARGWFDNPEE